LPCAYRDLYREWNNDDGNWYCRKCPAITNGGLFSDNLNKKHCILDGCAKGYYVENVVDQIPDRWHYCAVCDGTKVNAVEPAYWVENDESSQKLACKRACKVNFVWRLTTNPKWYNCLACQECGEGYWRKNCGTSSTDFDSVGECAKCDTATGIQFRSDCGDFYPGHLNDCPQKGYGKFWSTPCGGLTEGVRTPCTTLTTESDFDAMWLQLHGTFTDLTDNSDFGYIPKPVDRSTHYYTCGIESKIGSGLNFTKRDCALGRHPKAQSLLSAISHNTVDDCTTCTACDPGYINVGCIGSQYGSCVGFDCNIDHFWETRYTNSLVIETNKDGYEINDTHATVMSGIEISYPIVNAVECFPFKTYDPLKSARFSQINNRDLADGYWAPGHSMKPQRTSPLLQYDKNAGTDDIWIPCLTCDDSQFEQFACRHDETGYDATKNRVCAPCSGITDACDVGFYRSCGGGGETKTESEARTCQPCNTACPLNHYIDGCGYNNAGTCEFCSITCAEGERADTSLCDGNDVDRNRAFCVMCDHRDTYLLPSSNAVYVDDDDKNFNCNWECEQGYYTATNITCELCSTETCSVGFWRQPCEQGSTKDAPCLKCGGVDRCLQGQFIERCDGTTVANVDDVCVACKQDSCVNGETRTSCSGNELSDAICRDCGAVVANSTLTGLCSYMCNAGFFQTSQGSCQECSTGICNTKGVYTLCKAGQAFTDATCECPPGTQKIEGVQGLYCTDCTEYQVSETGLVCHNCNEGEEGIIERTGEVCMKCDVNHYRDEHFLLNKCAYCESGTDGARGKAYCHDCEDGEKSKQLNFSGYLWNYLEATGAGWHQPIGVKVLDENLQNPNNKRYWVQTVDMATEEKIKTIFWATTPVHGDISSGTSLWKQSPEIAYACETCSEGEVYAP
jgi:hypothetical protein